MVRVHLLPGNIVYCYPTSLESDRSFLAFYAFDFPLNSPSLLKVGDDARLVTMVSTLLNLSNLNCYLFRTSFPYSLAPKNKNEMLMFYKIHSAYFGLHFRRKLKPDF